MLTDFNQKNLYNKKVNLLSFLCEDLFLCMKINYAPRQPFMYAGQLFKEPMVALKRAVLLTVNLPFVQRLSFRMFNRQSVPINFRPKNVNLSSSHSKSSRGLGIEKKPGDVNNSLKHKLLPFVHFYSAFLVLGELFPSAMISLLDRFLRDKRLSFYD